MNRNYVAFALALGIMSGGCATQPSDITATHVSALTYQNATCRELEAEARTLGRTLTDLVSSQRKAAGNDSAKVAIGVIFFWPAALLALGGKDHEEAIARAKGTLIAVETAAVQKGCHRAIAAVDSAQKTLVTMEQMAKTKETEQHSQDSCSAGSGGVGAC